MSSQPSQFAYALADFSMNLYQQIGTKNKESDIFMSPLSISFSLAMIYAGAQGDTKAQMKKVLFGDNMSIETDQQVHTLYAEVMGSLNKGDSNYKSHLVNRVYFHEPSVADLSSEFTNILKEKYKAELQAVNFGDDDDTARDLVNSYVTEKTNQKITDLSSDLSPMTRLVLINAIYFKGDWKTKFDAAQTQKMQFFVGPNNEIEMEMMRTHGEFQMREFDSFQLVGLPYVGGYLDMFILMPNERFGLEAIEKQLTGKKLLELIWRMQKQKQAYFEFGLVSIPKFKLEETPNLLQSLEKLGTSDMLSGQKADFSNINGQKTLVVSEMMHKAFIEVNEGGTEAAAGSDLVVGLHFGKSAGPTFVADHPFLFAIADMLTTSILFLGRFTGEKEQMEEYAMK